MNLSSPEEMDSGMILTSISVTFQWGHLHQHALLNSQLTGTETRVLDKFFLHMNRKTQWVIIIYI